MSTNEYHFITHWRVRSNLEEINEILYNATDLARWWPSVYLEVRELEPGDENGVGKVAELYTKGWLPYTLSWSFRVVEVRPPYGFTLKAWGDLVGRGIWTFEPHGDEVSILYDWKVVADKPLLRRFSALLKPFFSANHHWAMAKGEESLKLELLRRNAASEEERLKISPPPGPSFPWLLPLMKKRDFSPSDG